MLGWGRGGVADATFVSRLAFALAALGSLGATPDPAIFPNPGHLRFTSGIHWAPPLTPPRSLNSQGADLECRIHDVRTTQCAGVFMGAESDIEHVAFNPALR